MAADKTDILLQLFVAIRCKKHIHHILVTFTVKGLRAFAHPETFSKKRHFYDTFAV